MTIVTLDVLVAILAGMAIFPIVFAHHLPPGEGPGLMFEILPIAFSSIAGGQFFGSLFFILLLFAAWTSSISIAEPLVILLTERKNLSRLHASIIVGVFSWLLGLASLFSFNVWRDFKVFHEWTIFSAITDLSTNILLPLGGLGFALFAGWIMAKKTTAKELQMNSILFNIWWYLIRYVAPLGIILIIVNTLISKPT
jgi:NSS family neurotransmitter:Na+ symporter